MEYINHDQVKYKEGPKTQKPVNRIILAHYLLISYAD